MSNAKSNHINVVLWFLIVVFVLLTPTDLVGVYGPLSVFKIASVVLVPGILILSLYHLRVLRKDFGFRALAAVLTIQISCLVANAMFSSPTPEEEVKLIAVFCTLLLQLFAFSVALRTLGLKKIAMLLGYGFGLLSVATFLSMIFGYANYSSSGRLAGLFRSSTTMAFFPVIMFSFSLGAARVGWIGWKLATTYCISATALLFLSGSRAGLLFPLVIIGVIVLVRIKNLFFRVALSIFAFIAVSAFHAVFFEKVGSLLMEVYEATDLSVAKRMGEFAIDLTESSDLEDLDAARSMINDAALDEINDSFPFLGRGLETSTSLTPFAIKPHNLFLNTFYEMGVVVFLLYSGCFLIGFCFSFCNMGNVVSNNGRELAALILAAAFWMSLKTPFFLQSSLYWFIWHMTILYCADARSQNQQPTN